MNTKLIDMVCTANFGRSPFAELVARQHLIKTGAFGEYDTISSGTGVAEIKERIAAPQRLTGNKRNPYKEMIVRKAFERGDVFAQDESDVIKAALQKDGDADVLTRYFLHAVDLFEQEEDAHRRGALEYFGIEGALKDGQDQTIAQADRIAVLSMGLRNNAVVQEIYAGSGISPVIETLSNYALRETGAEVPNAFGKHNDAYLRTAEAIVAQVPIALERLLG